MYGEYEWLNEPKRWSIHADRLSLTSDAATDYWRMTHYGFVRDSGHFFGVRTGPQFTAQARVSAAFKALYDQAGLMVRIDAEHWVKITIEVNDGVPYLSTVVTDGVSDWSTGVFNGDVEAFWLRVTVQNGVLKAQASVDGQHWPLIRLAPFPQAEQYWVGPMVCTPERGGLQVTFSEVSVTAPNGKSLHDLT